MTFVIDIDPYEKQDFVDGQILIAEQMNHIEDGIYKNTLDLEEVVSELETVNSAVVENTSIINNIKDKVTIYTDVSNDGDIKIEYGEA